MLADPSQTAFDGWGGGDPVRTEVTNSYIEAYTK